MKKNSNLISYVACALLFIFAFSANVYAACPLGPDVTKDLHGALNIIKIIVPLLVIGLSTMDAIKAITKGDGGADMKNVAIRFGKRCLYALILFFLPVIINQVMIMADVWNTDGTCDIDNPTSNGTEEATTTEAKE